MTWLASAVGGKDWLARRSGNRVSLRTLDNWTAGRYPQAKVTGVVHDLDAWAKEHVPCYPEAAGVPGLVDCCGPHRWTHPSPADLDVRAQSAGSSVSRRRWFRWAVPATVLAVAVVVVLQITGGLAAEPLPTQGTGDPLPETTGGLGANTFADPVLLQDNAMGIPPDTTVQVRCRFYAPASPAWSPTGTGT